MNEQDIRRIIKEEMSSYFKSDRMTMFTLLQFLDGRNVQLGKSVGTKIGLATTEKLAFHGSTPIIQSASANQAALSLDVTLTGANTIDRAAVEANFTSIETLANQLRTDLINKGIIKGSA